jgi:hypothetical protein
MHKQTTIALRLVQRIISKFQTRVLAYPSGALSHERLNVYHGMVLYQEERPHQSCPSAASSSPSSSSCSFAAVHTVHVARHCLGTGSPRAGVAPDGVPLPFPHSATAWHSICDPPAARAARSKELVEPTGSDFESRCGAAGDASCGRCRQAPSRAWGPAGRVSVRGLLPRGA